MWATSEDIFFLLLLLYSLTMSTDCLCTVCFQFYWHGFLTIPTLPVLCVVFSYAALPVMENKSLGVWKVSDLLLIFLK